MMTRMSDHHRRRRRRCFPLAPPLPLSPLIWMEFIVVMIFLFRINNTNDSIVDAALSCVCSTTFGGCNPDQFCSDNYRRGSTCNAETQECTNPLSSGCLQGLLGKRGTDEDEDEDGTASGINNNNHRSWKLRVCNSDDPSTAVEQGLCHLSKFNYTEIRIHHSNWESSIFYAWILQILLSEVLEVPVTIGYTNDTKMASFYNEDNTFTYSPITYPWSALEEANRMENADCLATDKDCVHVLPEVWNGQESVMTEAHNTGMIDAPEGNGMVGKISFYVPAFVARRDPTLVSFYGLQGLEIENRQRLADTFLRPTTYKEYCEEVSTTNCTEPDSIAQRYPNQKEENSYFTGAYSYIGHFRATEQNNCTLNPTTCTGHIVAPPCSWTTFLDAQVYWNQIALESNGPEPRGNSYGYGAMIEIWNAAVATESNVIMWWWKPEGTIEQFRGGPGEFQQVMLPEATDACTHHRVSPTARCSTDVEERRGSDLGACDSEAHSLGKVVASGLQKATEAIATPLRSPAYEAIKNLKVSDLEMNRILKRWILRGVDTYGYDPREAVCNWVAENIDDLLVAMPPTYPRTLDDRGRDNLAQVLAMEIFGACGVIAVLLVAFYSYRYRATRIFVYAQPNFCYLILAGLLLSSIAAIFYVVDPSTATCTATQWLVVIGFTLELTPLLVKVAAINRIQQAARRFKRVTVDAKGLYYAVAAVIFLTLAFLISWTVIDAPTSAQRYVMSRDDDTVVEVTRRCDSTSYAWNMAVLGWMGLLLVMTTVLAFQSRNVPQRFNETKSLVSMIYAHFLFKILGFVVYVLEDALDPYVLPVINSCLLTLDTLAVLAIYFAPKLKEAIRPDVTTNDSNDSYSKSDPKYGLSKNGSKSSILKDGSTAEQGSPGYIDPARHMTQTRIGSLMSIHDGSQVLESIHEGSNEESKAFSVQEGSQEEEEQEKSLPSPLSSTATKRLTFDGNVREYEYENDPL